MLFVTLT